MPKEEEIFTRLALAPEESNEEVHIVASLEHPAIAGLVAPVNSVAFGKFGFSRKIGEGNKAWSPDVMSSEEGRAALDPSGKEYKIYSYLPALSSKTIHPLRVDLFSNPFNVVSTYSNGRAIKHNIFGDSLLTDLVAHVDVTYTASDDAITSSSNFYYTDESISTTKSTYTEALSAEQVIAFQRGRRERLTTEVFAAIGGLAGFHAWVKAVAWKISAYHIAFNSALIGNITSTDHAILAVQFSDTETVGEYVARTLTYGS